MNQDYLEWKQWEAVAFGQCSNQAAKYLFWHVHRALPNMPANANVLEVGFGNGQFLAFCRSHGLAVTGVEVNKQLVNRARSSGYRAAESVEQTLDVGPFDLIVAFDVLEHLDASAVGSFFGSLQTSLAEGGCLLVRVPNGDSPFGRRHQHGDLTHVSTFGEFKIRQLAQMWNLLVVAVGESPWYIDEFERPSAKAMVRGLLKKLIELLFGFVFYKQRVCLDANLVVVLRKASKDHEVLRT